MSSDQVSYSECESSYTLIVSVPDTFPGFPKFHLNEVQFPSSDLTGIGNQGLTETLLSLVIFY